MWMKLGTKVKNPMRRHGHGYTECCHCHKYFTEMGISRHWGKCPENPKNKQEVLHA